MMDLDVIIKSWEYCNEGIGCDPECPLIIDGEACIDVLNKDTLEYLKELKALKEKKTESSDAGLKELRELLLTTAYDDKISARVLLDWIDLKLNEYVDRDADDVPKQSFKDQDIDRRNEEPNELYYKHDETLTPVHIPFKIGDVVYSVERIFGETNHIIIIYRVAGYDLRCCKENGLRLTTLIAIDVNTGLFKHFNIEHDYNNYLFPTFEEAEKKLMELRKEKEAK